jgi:uncharacterized protein YndB with AHSA1/START domain
VIAFDLTIDVARAPAAVFAYVTDPRNLPAWQGTAAVEQLTAGPVAVGTRFRETHERMGRRLESVTEVTAYEPDRRFAVRVAEGPVPIDGDWRFAPADGGTRIDFSASVQLSGAMRVLRQLIARAVRRQMRRDHERLKQLLESQPST